VDPGRVWERIDGEGVTHYRPYETLRFSTSAFAGVRMLKEAVGESQGSVPIFLMVFRDRPPVGILIRSAS